MQLRSYGFTGISLWIDPDRHLFVILLPNRVYSTLDNRSHVSVRHTLTDLAHQVLQGEPRRLVPER